MKYHCISMTKNSYFFFSFYISNSIAPSGASTISKITEQKLIIVTENTRLVNKEKTRSSKLKIKNN